jgi:hypothetical protein
MNAEFHDGTLLSRWATDLCAADQDLVLAKGKAAQSDNARTAASMRPGRTLYPFGYSEGKSMGWD